MFSGHNGKDRYLKISPNAGKQIIPFQITHKSKKKNHIGNFKIFWI